MVLVPRYAPGFLDELRRRLPLAELVGRDVKLVRHGAELTGLCPFHAERTPSFTIVPAKGFFHCFGCGAHGDQLGYAMRRRGLDFVAAVQLLAAECGLAEPGQPGGAAPPPPAKDGLAAEVRQDKIAAARDLLGQSVPGTGTLADRYWRARGLDFPLPRSLRFMPSLGYFHHYADARGRRQVERGRFPAILAPIKCVGAAGAPDAVTGVHRTWLRADGLAKAPVRKPKKCLGSVWRGAIRLSPAARQLIVGEGIETTASGAAPHWDPGLGMARIGGEPTGIWAAISLGNLAGGGLGEGAPHPQRPGQRLPSPVPDPARPGIVLPRTVESVIILEDADNGDPDAARCLYARAVARFADLDRRHVRLVAPDAGDCDFNDVLRGAA